MHILSFNQKKWMQFDEITWRMKYLSSQSIGPVISTIRPFGGEIKKN